MLDIKEKRHITVVGRGGASNIDWEDIENKPDFATVATSGSYNDLTDKPEIPGQVNADWDATSGVAQILNKPELAAVATSGSYNDLTDKPTILTQWFGTQAEYDAIETKDPNTIYNIEGGQAQANWTENDSSNPSYIQNKPTLATVATSGSYSDLSNTPNLATVATSGSYADLSNKPTIPAAQVNADWDANSGVSQILNKPNLATVATSGSYNDLSNKPAVKEDLDLSTLTQAQYVDFYTNYATYKANYDLNWGGMPILSINSWQPDTSISPVPLIVLEYGIYGQSALMTGGDDEVYFGVQLIGADGSVTPYSSSMTFKQICHTASYNDLVDKPTIPAAQVNADWDANSGVSQILNKPNLATVATSGSYNDLSNKPEIPSVPAMATQELTFTLDGGTTRTINFYVVPNYFYVEDVSGSNNTLSIKKDSASAPDIEVFYSTDKANWTSMGTTSTTAITATIPANSKLYLKANTTKWAFNIITASGNHNVGGNIMSLIYSDNFTNQTSLQSNATFRALFKNNNKIVNSNNLELPATTLTNSCYTEMFSYCSALTTAPALPATTLTNSCYSNMFEYCSALTTAPALPATTLANSCYKGMFRYCISLTTAPELPATTLADLCYCEMFYFCTSLTTAPELPATTMYQACYESMFQQCSTLTTVPLININNVNKSGLGYMFYNCYKLNSVITNISNISSNNYMKNWLANVAATGDFYNLGGATFQSGASGIPSGWTEYTSL